MFAFILLVFAAGDWRVTGYCACTSCCGPSASGITASGRIAKPGIAAGPRSMRFGTSIWVEGYGHADIYDRGGAIRGRRIDLFFSDHLEAIRWGSHRMTARWEIRDGRRTLILRERRRR